jgi:hypothetical protein
MDTMLKTEEVCNHIAAGAISAPTPGELRPLHSEIANRAVQRERGVQVQIGEQMRIQQMKEEDYWAEVERDQGVQTRAINTAAAARRKMNQRTMAADCQREITRREQKEAAERVADIEETRRLAHQAHFVEQREQMEEDRKLQRELQLKQEGLEARHAVEARKQREKEEEIATERRIARDAGELSAARDARVVRDKQNRDDKRLTSRRLVETTAKQLAQARAREVPEEIRPSGCSVRDDARRKAETERRREAQQERCRDYNEMVRLKEMPVEKIVQPDFDNRENDIIRADESRMKMLNMQCLGAYQRRQAAERAERNRQERIARLTERTDRDTMYFLWDNQR